MLCPGPALRVYASGNLRHLSTGMCAGNQLLAEQAAIPPASLTADEGEIPASVLVVLAAAVIVALASLAAFRRSRGA